MPKSAHALCIDSPDMGHRYIVANRHVREAAAKHELTTVVPQKGSAAGLLRNSEASAATLAADLAGESPAGGIVQLPP